MPNAQVADTFDSWLPAGKNFQAFCTPLCPGTPRHPQPFQPTRHTHWPISVGIGELNEEHEADIEVITSVIPLARGAAAEAPS